MVFISARQPPTPASDSPTPIQRAVFRASCIASFQHAPAADPRRLRLLDEPKLLLDCQQPAEDPITVLAFEAAPLTRGGSTSSRGRRILAVDMVVTGTERR